MNRLLLSFTWVEENVLICSTKQGELLCVSIPDSKEMFHTGLDVDRLVLNYDKVSHISELEIRPILSPNDLKSCPGIYRYIYACSLSLSHTLSVHSLHLAYIYIYISPGMALVILIL